MPEPSFPDSAELTAFAAGLEVVRAAEPGVADAIAAELASQRSALKLIASENYASPAVLLAMGNWLSDKYAEGTAGRRVYAGCQQVDAVEEIAAGHARKLFGMPYAYVQPHSGIDANLVAFWAILAARVEKPGAGARWGPACERPVRAGLGGAAGGAGESAAAGHVAGRGRAPDPWVPAEHLRQDVRSAQLRHRSGHRPHRLRRGPRDRTGVPAADSAGRVLRLPAADQLPGHAGDCRRGRARR